MALARNENIFLLLYVALTGFTSNFVGVTMEYFKQTVWPMISTKWLLCSRNKNSSYKNTTWQPRSKRTYAILTEPRVITNIQEGDLKFLGHFKCHFGSQMSFKSIRQLHITWNDEWIQNLHTHKKWVWLHNLVLKLYTVDCLANISTEEASTVLLGN